MIRCVSCQERMEWSEREGMFVHAVVTPQETLRALKCRAFLSGVALPYRVMWEEA